MGLGNGLTALLAASRDMNNRQNGYVLAAMLAIAIWVSVAQAVFAFRHPWATETQRFLYFFDAMLFRSVECPYSR